MEKVTLAIKTNEPNAELALIQSGKVIAQEKWLGHNTLSATLNRNIEKLLKDNNLSMKQICGIIVYEGPGSFTGLRIGLALANTLANLLLVPIAGGSGKNWQQSAQNKLSKNHKMVLPVYGELAHTTQPKK